MGLVYTNDNCIGCNKCINACSCDGANVAKEVNGKNRIEVDPDRCIACGACKQICPQNIDIPSVLEDLTNTINSMTSWKEICKQREEESKRNGN